ncbi:uncharacterized protein JG29_16000 [Bombilactobacillus mellis]|uniref:Uncharacterized protein n=1 Tax=Bombilactobacillus mellis TaxID=1218508 RepID=A0A0F4KNV8_9LACO|nr:DUF5388 domain-containing protein [Bombilactobacillus mellis]KJY48085.1 uncharacterized protein JG29_16000 [Bombilactobacillus mellis]
MTENNNFYKINGYVTLEKVDPELPENKDQVTFDTNLKISNHSRNKLQAMASIGYSENQRSAVDVALQAWYDTLTVNEQKEFDLQVHTLEQRDVKIKSKK